MIKSLARLFEWTDSRGQRKSFFRWELNRNYFRFYHVSDADREHKQA